MTLCARSDRRNSQDWGGARVLLDEFAVWEAADGRITSVIEDSHERSRRREAMDQAGQ
jgi:hypothetical protein